VKEKVFTRREGKRENRAWKERKPHAIMRGKKKVL